METVIEVVVLLAAVVLLLFPAGGKAVDIHQLRVVAAQNNASFMPPPDDSNSSPPPSPGNNSPALPNNRSPPPPPPHPRSSNSTNQSPPPPLPSPPHNRSPPPPLPPRSSNSINQYPPPPPPSPPPPPPPSHPPPPPPLPPYSSRSIAPPRRSSPPSSSRNSGIDSPQRMAIIAGVTAAAGLLLVVMIALLKKRKPRDNSNGTRSDYYNTGGGQANWTGNNSQYGEHHIAVPPPTGSGGVISEHGWSAQPPPPRSGGFSGARLPPVPPPHPSLALGFNKSSFTYEELAAATGGFAQTNLLGQGGFGYVHKGVLPNGKEIAVKSLKSGSEQGESEFQAEADIISRVHHRHLVSLVGYCISGAQRMLVYEFVPNRTLQFHLHGAERPTMNWPTRLRIALGSAKGFAYLHEDCHPRVIHRDIKAANILLDINFEAKVADFGLAKLFSDQYTHVKTRVMGTFGYFAPEYASSGKLTEKSDVYSYGVMLLELITGRRPTDISTDGDSFVDWVRPILLRVLDGGSLEEMVDSRLHNQYDPQEMLRMVACAAACIRHSAKMRPKMSQIVRALEGNASLEDLHEGIKPGHSAIFSYDGINSSNNYNVEMKMLRKPGGLSSQEFTSSEHFVTGEFVVPNGKFQKIRANNNRSRLQSP